MTESEVRFLAMLAFFALAVIVAVWLIRRARPTKRTHWFVAVCIALTLLLGIYEAPVAIALVVGLLAMFKTSDESPLRDIFSGLGTLFASGAGIASILLMPLLGVGGLHWLWLAIQMKSFPMFLVGIFPLSIFVTAPVGAYALVFDTPAWVIRWFGS